MDALVCRFEIAEVNDISGGISFMQSPVGLIGSEPKPRSFGLEAGHSISRQAKVRVLRVDHTR
jgi:hypothetical protein